MAMWGTAFIHSLAIHILTLGQNVSVIFTSLSWNSEVLCISFMCTHIHYSNELEGKGKVSWNCIRHCRLFKSGWLCSSHPVWIECICRGLDCFVWKFHGENYCQQETIPIWFYSYQVSLRDLHWATWIKRSISMVTFLWSCESYLHPQWWCWWQEEQEYQTRFLLYCIYPWQYQKIWNHVNK
jgi:hypothetical protein